MVSRAEPGRSRGLRRGRRGRRRRRSACPRGRPWRRRAFRLRWSGERSGWLLRGSPRRPCGGIWRAGPGRTSNRRWIRLPRRRRSARPAPKGEITGGSAPREARGREDAGRRFRRARGCVSQAGSVRAARRGETVAGMRRSGAAPKRRIVRSPSCDVLGAAGLGEARHRALADACTRTSRRGLRLWRGPRRRRRR